LVRSGKVWIGKVGSKFVSSVIWVGILVWNGRMCSGKVWSRSVRSGKGWSRSVTSSKVWINKVSGKVILSGKAGSALAWSGVDRYGEWYIGSEG
jgi:hypothetical protein